MTTVITAKNLSKKYIISHQKLRYRQTLRETMTSMAKSLYQRLRHPLSPNSETQNLEEFWALKDINFEVKEGERIGIIGRNGAGKSTLLKVLSRITDPTTGRIHIKGRVSSLLEVGTGFHPELSGRENIFLNGAILGMTRQEIKQKFDEIVDFAEIEKFIDTPVKRYSSGMYVRLAFAVAAHLEPEILIVDEVLAVGDAQFQKKCLGKMKDVADEGRTVLFVSHNMAAVRHLTQKSVYLVDGKIATYDKTDQVLDQYMIESLNRTQLERHDISSFRRNNNPNAIVHFKQIWVNESQEKLGDISVFEPFTIFMSLDVKQPVTDAAVAINIKNTTGDVVTTVISADDEFKVNLPCGSVTIACRIEDLHLPPGTYMVDAGINSAVGALAWDVIKDYPSFRVVNLGSKMLTCRPDRPGTVLCDNVHWYRLEGRENRK